MKKLLPILMIVPVMAYAQSDAKTQVDSIKQVIATAQHDTVLVNAYMAWDNLIYISDPELDLELNLKIKDLCNQGLQTETPPTELSFYKEKLAFAYNNIGNILWGEGQYDSALVYHNQSLQLKQETGNNHGIAISYNNIGNIYYEQGAYELALTYYTKSLVLQRELKDDYGISYCLNNIGMVYKMQGDYAKAIEHYTESLQIQERAGNSYGAALPLTSIGVIYQAMTEYETALKYHKKAYEYRLEAEDIHGTGASLANIGIVYKSMGNSDQAFLYLGQSIKTRIESNDQYGLAYSYLVVGTIHADLNQSDSAFFYYFKALDIQYEIDDKPGIAEALNNLATLSINNNNYKDGLQYATNAMNVAQDVGAIAHIRDAAWSLYLVHAELGNHQKALDNFELHITMRDSIESEENQKEIIRQEYKYEYDKQSLADSLAFAQQQELDALNHQAELDKEAQQRYALYGGLGFLLVLGGMAFRGYQRKKKDNTLITEQKKEVELQKHLVEEKNTEILDSITYAKRIQEAILPPTRLVKEWLPNSFVLYKPKDIVAGDFYWMEAVDGHSIGQQNADNTIIFAAADCTGHGVPGAMVSVVCHNAMNRAVREFGLTQPGAILDKTRELVIEQFEKSDEDVKDGMDIALCSLTGNTLHYAGAHNPLWIVRDCQAEPVEALNNPNVSVFRQAQDDTQCIIEIKATKQPIGKIDNPQPFTNHTIELQPNDAFYIFSDGFVDQFGGQKGKKFKAKAFRELLLSIQDRNMEEQRMLINEEFEQWRGDLEQVDDVCVIGVKV